MPDLFQLDGIEGFESAIKTFIEVAERDISEGIKRIAYAITYNLVMETPQYSGAAASAWRVGIGAPEYITEKPDFEVPKGATGISGAVPDAPFSKRNRNTSAVSEALTFGKVAISAYTLGRGDVYISNGLEYAQWFELGQYDKGKALRQQNMPHRVVDRVMLDSMNILPILGA